MLLSDQALANEIRNSVVSAASNIREVVADLKEGRGVAGMLLRDEAVAGQVRDAVKNAQQATADFSHVSHQADALVSELNSQQLPRKASDMMDSLNDSASRSSNHFDIAKHDQLGTSTQTTLENHS
jgi:phospholipid/cholesterol/gamma-HCH transport system substrate-binding protein